MGLFYSILYLFRLRMPCFLVLKPAWWSPTSTAATLISVCFCFLFFCCCFLFCFFSVCLEVHLCLCLKLMLFQIIAEHKVHICIGKVGLSSGLLAPTLRPGFNYCAQQIKAQSERNRKQTGQQWKVTTMLSSKQENITHEIKKEQTAKNEKHTNSCQL